MAEINNDVVKYFRGSDTFETEERSLSVSEVHTQTVSAVAPYEYLRRLNLAIGETVPSFISQGTVTFGTLYIRDYRIDRIDGDMGRITINCVEAGSRTRPYNVTVDIDLAQVEKRLINHPLMKNTETQYQIRLFEQTDEYYQFDEEGNPQYVIREEASDESSSDSTSNSSSSSSGESSGGIRVRKLTDENAIKYAKAKLIGVDSYSIYLPIITRTSQYLSLPGVSISRSNMEASGTASPDDIEKIGEFDTPPIQIKGFTSGGLWFKNGDRFTQNANGSWTRVESWTYTNDLRTSWIYENGAAKQIVEEGSEENNKK